MVQGLGHTACQVGVADHPIAAGCPVQHLHVTVGQQALHDQAWDVRRSVRRCGCGEMSGSFVLLFLCPGKCRRRYGQARQTHVSLIGMLL